MGAIRAAATTILVFGTVLTALFWPYFAFDTLRRLCEAPMGVPSAWREGSDVFTYILALAGIWSIVIPAVIVARQRQMRLTARTIALLPVYHILVSAAAWTAIVDLFVRPHYWSKTAHGRAPRRRAETAPVRPTIGVATAT